MYRLIILFCTLLASGVLGATVYKWTDLSGQVHYTDQWREGATPVDLPEPSVYSPRIPPTQNPSTDASPADTEAEPAEAYDELIVNSPLEGETVRSNEGVVAVSLLLQPTLRRGDTIELFMDGERLDEGFRTTSVTVSNLDRGSHILQARVVDDAGRELIASQPVNFHLRRESKLFPQRQTPPPAKTQ